MKNNTLFVLSIIAVVLCAGQIQAAHPFLIVTEANFPDLQARASSAPWSTMKSQAISSAGITYYPDDDDFKGKVINLSNIVSGCALAYILDTPNRTTYQNRLYDLITNSAYWPALLTEMINNNPPNTGSYDFPYVVITGGAYFNTVLALDVMYNGFTAGQITDMETELQAVADWYESISPSWQLNLYGCRGIWALYINDRTKIDAAKADYRDELFNQQITTDGVGRQGPGYPGIRLSHYEREAKGNFMDVLTFTGEENYYADPVAINLMEWLYGYGTTPFREFYTFGDTAPNRSYHEQGASVFRAYRFSDKAGRYAAWINNSIPPLGRLLHYVFYDQPLMTPERGPSRIFPDGGAWFVESGTDTRALSAALWNPMDTESHAHKDVSAIHTAAYGEHIIRNSGYAGWGLPSGEWTYVHDEAFSNSTALINYTDHAQKYGAGIAEGFVAPDLGFDYACSDSGPAISNGSHYRSLLFIHPNIADGTDGYWLLFDEFDADNSSHQANTLLHPNASNMDTITSNTEYQSTISNLTFSGHDVYISMFLGTPPTSTSIYNATLAHMSNQSFAGKCLRSNYDTDGSGIVNVVTALFPHDSTHAKATMARVTGTGYTGASITKGGIVDIALESDGASTVTYSDVSFQGLATWYREDSGLVTSYFVRKGSTFDDGVSPRVGFDSVSDVSIYMNDMEGKIISPGTNVTFFHPSVTDISLNGSPLSPISSGLNWVQVNIPAGTHEVQFNLWTGGADLDIDGDVDFRDFAILASQWEQIPGIPSADIAPAGGDNFVDTLDLAELVDEWLVGAGAPTPDPLTWATAPSATNSTTISMVATTAYDPMDVEYYFDCTAGGGHDSGWQDGTTYLDTELDPNTQYTYQVKARDKSPYQNETAYSNSASATTDVAPLMPPAVSYYQFEGDFSNSISGPAATAVGNAQITTDGERGQVLSLDGSGDYLDCGNDSIENEGAIILETAITLAAWIKSSDMDGDDGIISYGWAWRMLGDGGVIAFKNTTLSVATFSGTVSVDDGEWHHVAVTYDSADEILAIYVDGEPDTSTACTGTLNTWNGYQFAIGYVLSGTHGYFNGLMDNASVYDYALSAEEIEDLAGIVE
ncbi:MAG: heparinase II/III family protein [Planctomycetes bacterium]|nr:heparinase II/III family protein [Planctomycetota bacterium]